MSMNNCRVAAIFCGLTWLGLFSSASEAIAVFFVPIGSYAIALLIDRIWSAKATEPRASQASHPESDERGFQFPAE